MMETELYNVIYATSWTNQNQIVFTLYDSKAGLSLWTSNSDNILYEITSLSSSLFEADIVNIIYDGYSGLIMILDKYSWLYVIDQMTLIMLKKKQLEGLKDIGSIDFQTEKGFFGFKNRIRALFHSDADGSSISWLKIHDFTADVALRSPDNIQFVHGSENNVVSRKENYAQVLEIVKSDPYSHLTNLVKDGKHIEAKEFVNQNKSENTDINMDAYYKLCVWNDSHSVDFKHSLNQISVSVHFFKY